MEWARIRSRTDHEGTSGSAAMAVPRLATTGSRKDQQQRRRPDLLLVGGIVGFTLSLGAYVLIKYVVRQANESPGDLEVYRQAGLVVRHAAHWYDPTLSSPLYDWPKYQLPFTYTPFAALVFTVLTLSALHVAANLWIAASLVALVVALWATFGGLGYRAGARLGGALLIAAVMLWIEPVLQALSLGQIELMLMALVIWDMCQPDRRWWKGAGIGIAAGIKLAPLIFIPYLLLTRRFRAAAVAAGTFVATVVLGYFVLPADSRQFWLGGVFMQSGRPGFPGEMQNQALGGLITRLAGSVAAGHWIWLPVAVIIGLLGLAIATVLHRAGHEVLGVLTCALTGLLVSPITWDHHWVWIVPAVAVLAVYGSRACGAARWTYLGSAAAIVVVFGAWPHGVVRRVAVSLWGQPPQSEGYYGFIFAPPFTTTGTYLRLGDQGWYAEYHWHGLELVVGNLYVLAGLTMFVLLAAAALAVTLKAASGLGDAARMRRRPLQHTPRHSHRDG